MLDISIDHNTLKARQRSLRADFPDTMGLRVHRAISWIWRAERCMGDDDARFLFLWIAFCAAHAGESNMSEDSSGLDTSSSPAPGPKARDQHRAYFETLVRLDPGKRIYGAIWQKFHGPIRVLMDNHFVFSPFWRYHNGEADFADWEGKFKSSSRHFRSCFKRGDTVGVLRALFDRLYVLRNQIVHGGSTWNSNANRDQVRDGAAILGFMMPLFVDIMMSNPHEDWGRPFYPVVE